MPQAEQTVTQNNTLQCKSCRATLHFTVNACTGEVIGERPYSAIKIALAVIVAILIIIRVFLALNK